MAPRGAVHPSGMTAFDPRSTGPPRRHIAHGVPGHPAPSTMLNKVDNPEIPCASRQSAIIDKGQTRTNRALYSVSETVDTRGARMLSGSRNRNGTGQEPGPPDPVASQLNIGRDRTTTARAPPLPDPLAPSRRLAAPPPSGAKQPGSNDEPRRNGTTARAA